jgi:hypothetical protein
MAVITFTRRAVEIKTPRPQINLIPPRDSTSKNSGSVDLTLTIRELRPSEVHSSRADEFILVVPVDYTSLITGTWTALAKHHHQAYSGQLRVEGPSRWTSWTMCVLSLAQIPRASPRILRNETRVRTGPGGALSCRWPSAAGPVSGIA